jgi:hypothetical protein
MTFMSDWCYLCVVTVHSLRVAVPPLCVCCPCKPSASAHLTMLANVQVYLHSSLFKAKQPGDMAFDFVTYANTVMPGGSKGGGGSLARGDCKGGSTSPHISHADWSLS